jgi:putative SOS response-associated peptidase YedK
MPAATNLFSNEREENLSIDAGPRRPGLVIRLHPKTGVRHLDWLTWGLLPHDTPNPDAALQPTHARAETVAELPLFADAFWHRRAFVPANEYYQRRTRGGPAQDFAISRRDGQPMAIAGLWDAYAAPDGIIARTYCIITVEAAGAVAKIHDRMPLVLEEKDWPLWLGEVPGDPTPLLHPAASDRLIVRAAGRRPRGRDHASR